MKVLHVAETIKGGIATYLTALYSPFGDRVELTVAIPKSQSSELGASLQAKTLLLPDTDRSVSGIWRHVREVRDAIKTTTPDIIHAHSAVAGFAVRILRLAGLHDCPIVYCPHGWAFDRPDNLMARLVYRFAELSLSAFAERIICISKHEYAQARKLGLPRRRLRLIYNGLPELEQADTDDLRYEASRISSSEGTETADLPLRIAFAGRLDRQKGFDILLDALTDLKRPFILVCIGAPVLKDAVTFVPEELKAYISTTGWLPQQDVTRHLAWADVAVVPSRWEGFGLVAAEAMRAGTPVIASRCGGLPEIVSHGMNGYLVPVNDPITLAHILETISLKQLKIFGIHGRNRFSRYFGADRMREKMVKIYAESHPDCRVS